MVKVLFPLLKSPFEKLEFDVMRAVAKDNEAGVLLFQDAVYYATTDHMRNSLLEKCYRIHALGDELAARGFGAFSAKGVEIIDYDRAVELIMEEYDSVISL